ncbi:RNA-directed DNA polymerase [bacterium]|nr:RNA-directed DNA polymerase [bacterium]
MYKIKKKNGKYRTIYEPNTLLKHIQTQILVNILNNKSISKYAKAYHKGIPLKENAIPHVKKNLILKLDIQNFFENISFVDIYNSCFPIEYFPKSVGVLLTYLCTYDEHLTQGSPTSSYISNLVMKDFDEELGAWCEKKDISYTRYSDDMTFSGDFDIRKLIKYVNELLYKEGFRLNKSKIKVVLNTTRQQVTGIVVNEKINLSKNYKRKIRQEVYYVLKYGVKSHIEKRNINLSCNRYLSVLLGKINYVLTVNPNDKEFINYKNEIKRIKNN